jgi:hypothetical protein
VKSAFALQHHMIVTQTLAIVVHVDACDDCNEV